jgi:glycosyltransferase involved in cell wall biosynthesis
LKITLISLHFAEYTARLALALAQKHSVQVHLSKPNFLNELSVDLRLKLEKSVDLHLHPQHKRKYMLIHGARLALAIRRFAPDIIHAQEAAAWTLWSSLLQLFPRRAKFVLTVHDPSPHLGGDTVIRRRTEWATQRIRLTANALLVHGVDCVRQMKAILPLRFNHVHSVEHGILGDMIPQVQGLKKVSFLFFGRIQTYKGLGVLIEAAQILQAKNLEFEVRIAGKGQDLEQYREYICSSSTFILEDRYIPAQDIPLLFSQSCAVVMPYLEATQSGVAALAISAKIPLIASAVGSIPEVITTEENGLLVPPNDPAALANAMERVICDSQLRTKLSQGAAHTAQTLLNWDIIAQKTARIYADL